MTHFCWLPPERLVTAGAVAGALMREPVDGRRAGAASRSAVDQAEPRESVPRAAIVMFSATASRSSRPCVLRSSVTRATPARDRLAGRAEPRRARRRADRRRRGGRPAPKRASSSSVRPAPSSPATPRTSPRADARSVDVAQDGAAARGGLEREARRPRAPSAPAALARAGRSARRSRGRPSSGSTCAGSVSARARWRRSRPSRSTVTRSARVNTSFILCEM